MGRTFEEAQATLRERLGSGGPSDMTEGTLVVVPSITFPEWELRKITGIQYYEERLLFLLLQLRNPDLRVVYVTSLRVEEPIVDYYLRFVPSEVDPGDRLYLVALWDQAPEALTTKLLKQDWAMERIAALAEDACLLTFNVTEHERELAERLDVPLYGCAPDLVWLGSKSGSRMVAREADVPVLEGTEDVHTVAEAEDAIRRLLERRPGAEACVLKLNNGFSGQGNVIVELDGEQFPLTESNAVFCAAEESWESYVPKMEDEGAIVEELVRGPGVSSPSAQLRIAPDGSYEILSTHDQILGGPEDQVYLGCRFPARNDYRLEIQELGGRIARTLAARGVMGSFGIDFLVVPSDTGTHIYLSEINLRLGGTTHPFLMTKLVTGGEYEESTGRLIVDGVAKCYMSTDNLKTDRYVGTEPEDLIAAVDRAGIAFDPRSNSGVTLHLLGALKRFGKVGAVCIGDSHDEARWFYEMFVQVLEAVAEGTQPAGPMEQGSR